MRKLLRWRTLGLVLLVLVLLAFPYGPLFPWSPVRPGYVVERFTRADVVYPRGIAVPEPYRHVDEYIVRAERFHQLPFNSRVTLVLCRNWSDFHRLMPTLGPVGGATLIPGTVIYITPKISEKALDPGEFIRHELSHAVLNQNQGVLAAWRAQRQQWFVEGLAVSFGEQRAFVTPEEFLARAQWQRLAPVIDPEQRSAAPAPFDMRFGYQAWRYFLEHLVESRGRARFQQFMIAYIADPNAYRSLFAKTYGLTLPDAIAEFEHHVRAGWKPNAAFVSAHLD